MTKEVTGKVVRALAEADLALLKSPVETGVATPKAEVRDE